MFISVIMMMGLFSVVYGSRNNYIAQNQLAELQDSERLAATLLTNSVMEAGYYPNPTANTKAGTLPAATYNSIAFAASQGIYGATVSSNDQLYVRYAAGTSDGMADCTGTTNSTASTVVDVNYFYISNNTLYCKVVSNPNASAQPLVMGVTGMAVLYGVDLNSDYSADEYMNAAAVTAGGYWNQVISVQVTLTFANPFTQQTAPGAGSPPAPTLSRTIDILNVI
jgi:type IV pilus assembly protein PilW